MAGNSGDKGSVGEGCGGDSGECGGGPGGEVLVEVAGEAEATVVAQVEVVRVAQEAIEREPCLSPEMGWDVLCAPELCRSSATPGRGRPRLDSYVARPWKGPARFHTRQDLPHDSTRLHTVAKIPG